MGFGMDQCIPSKVLPVQSQQYRNLEKNKKNQNDVNGVALLFS